ncbi:DUF4249 domain-containing protein [Muricauda sp. 2012CJ35-5]|uniref:DUF4249 domain-containing protein n=1 Tax=Flagellimonas spongiicola TaxID=2942208 RepID=A0ABT0PQS6_9FLAO|nr:DUF4249 family protein [Allomuricauda spongiicola]MCL6273052.1 DUF4249 domain-containing protein [Allomuricauda spongiicola]
MKRIIPYLVLVVCLWGCEDVIDVEVPTTEPRLIVNGVLRVDESQQFIPVEIKVTETTNFFEDNPVTELESAIIFYGQPNPDAPEILENLASSSLAEVNPGTGIYVPDPTFDEDQRISAQIIPGTVFILVVEHKGRTYAARTPYSPVVPIDNIEQGDETLFDEDDTEIKITFTDVKGIDNYYVFDFGFGEFLAADDQFIDGQQFEFSYFYDVDLEPGDEIEVSMMGADLEFFNYMDLLVEQTEDDGGVFETPAATARGNVFDITGLDNILVFDNVNRPEDFPLGYFAVVQERKASLVIE